MKQTLIVVLAIVLLLAGCSQSVMDKVTVTNVEHESYRPAGWDATDESTKFDWGGVIISGDITNNSNKTLTVAVVIHSYNGPTGKQDQYGESEIVRVDPGETEKFVFDFNYDEKNKLHIPMTHDISDVLLK